MSLLVTNNGSQQHNIVVRETGAQTPMLNGGENATLSLGSLDVGTYELYCSVAGHAESGMVAPLEITNSPAPTGEARVALNTNRLLGRYPGVVGMKTGYTGEAGRVLVSAPDGTRIPLSQLADIRYTRGPQVIKSEDTFLVGYVLFDKGDGYAEVDVVENAQQYLKEKQNTGDLRVPKGISYGFTGTYENQLRAARTLSVVVPLSLLIIFLILYFQFRSTTTSLMVFTGIAVAFAGGFLMIWLYGQDWFFNVNLLGENLRELFRMQPVNLSVAVWVGFIALFGIATDDGVLIDTYLEGVPVRGDLAEYAGLISTDRLEALLGALAAARDEIRVPLLAMVSYSIVYRRTPAQFVDRVGTAMFKGALRPAYRLALVGLFYLAVKALLVLIHRAAL